MKIDQEAAERILYAEAARAAAGHIDPLWEGLIEQLSELCQATSKTHIAFLGTAVLAKCVDARANAMAVKAGADCPGAYSARSLCHGVLVPNAPELDINLGVTGREPLNNQPYFRIDLVTRDVPVRPGKVTETFLFLCDVLDELEAIRSEEEARRVLRAFITVRRRYGKRFSAKVSFGARLQSEQLVSAIESFVAADSEGGKRAQAVVAALMDNLAGRERVVVGRVNDPDREVPGDVSIRAEGGEWERVIEVRDKAVSRQDLYLFASKAASAGVGDAAMTAFSGEGAELPIEEAKHWASDRGVALMVILSWRQLIEQALHWASTPYMDGVQRLPEMVYSRLQDLEVSAEGVEQWARAVGTVSPSQTNGKDPAPEVDSNP